VKAAPANTPDDPLVSVIVPAFNSAAFLPATLDSIVAQSYPRVEIVIVDDGSDDHTRDVVARYGDRIVYNRQAHFGGPSRPRNIGVSLASGDYLAFFDADDIMHEDKLAAQMAVFARLPNVGLVFSDFAVIDEQGRTTQERFLDSYRSFRRALRETGLPGCSVISGPSLCDALLRANFIGTSGVVARKNAVIEVGGFDESLLNADDIDLWHRLARAGREFAFLARPLHSYRRRSGSVSRRGSDRYRHVLRMWNKQLPTIGDPETLAYVRERMTRIRRGQARQLLREKRYREARCILRDVLKEKRDVSTVRWWVVAALLSVLPAKSEPRKEEW
jgi:glycosyltransferase involved in cell wall biosynthesis